jgi:hypothetical protein
VKHINIADLLQVEYYPGSEIVKKLTCTACKETVFSISDHPTQAELDRESVGFQAHLELRHGLAVTKVKCSDQKCLKCHQSP